MIQKTNFSYLYLCNICGNGKAGFISWKGRNVSLIVCVVMLVKRFCWKLGNLLLSIKLPLVLKAYAFPLICRTLCST